MNMNKHELLKSAYLSTAMTYFMRITNKHKYFTIPLSFSRRRGSRIFFNHKDTKNTKFYFPYKISPCPLW